MRAYAARTVARNCETWARRASDWRDSSPAAPSTWLAAAPVSSAALATLTMLPVTCDVPDEAWATLRTIYCVAAPCCSTAAAMAVAVVSMSRMRPAMPPIAATA
ncbi:hypothetical protein LFADAHJC_LOCUS53 [Methylorubrum extorquens]